MIIQYRHIFDSINDSKKITINLSNSFKNLNFSSDWQASGTSYDPLYSFEYGEMGDSVTFYCNRMQSCSSIWYFWLKEEPKYKISVKLVKNNCNEFANGWYDGDYDTALDNAINFYKNEIEKIYSVIDEKVKKIDESVNKRINSVKDKADAIYESSLANIEEANQKLLDTKDELDIVSNGLSNVTSEAATASITIDDLNGKIINSASFSGSMKNKIMTEVNRMIDGEIGGWIDSATTLNAEKQVKTWYNEELNTVNGYWNTTLESINVASGSVNTIVKNYDAVKGKLDEAVKSARDGLYSEVGQYFNSVEGKAALEGYVTDTINNEVICGGFDFNLSAQTMSNQLNVIDNVTQTIKSLAIEYDLVDKSITKLVAEQSKGANGEDALSYSEIKQELDSITQTVKNTSGYSGVYQNTKSYTLMVNDELNGKHAGLSLGYTEDGGSHIILDAENVVIPNKLIVGAVSAQTISLGHNASKFVADGSGYLAKGNIVWDKEGNITIKSSASVQGGVVVEALSARDVEIGSGTSKFYANGSGYVANNKIRWTADGKLKVDASCYLGEITFIDVAYLHLEDMCNFYNSFTESEFNELCYFYRFHCSEFFTDNYYSQYLKDFIESLIRALYRTYSATTQESVWVKDSYDDLKWNSFLEEKSKAFIVKDVYYDLSSWCKCGKFNEKKECIDDTPISLMELLDNAVKKHNHYMSSDYCNSHGEYNPFRYSDVINLFNSYSKYKLYEECFNPIPTSSGKKILGVKNMNTIIDLYKYNANPIDRLSTVHNYTLGDSSPTFKGIPYTEPTRKNGFFNHTLQRGDSKQFTNKPFFIHILTYGEDFGGEVIESESQTNMFHMDMFSDILKTVVYYDLPSYCLKEYNGMHYATEDTSNCAHRISALTVSADVFTVNEKFSSFDMRGMNDEHYIKKTIGKYYDGSKYVTSPVSYFDSDAKLQDTSEYIKFANNLVGKKVKMMLSNNSRIRGVYQPVYYKNLKEYDFGYNQNCDLFLTFKELFQNYALNHKCTYWNNRGLTGMSAVSIELVCEKFDYGVRWVVENFEDSSLSQAETYQDSYTSIVQEYGVAEVKNRTNLINSYPRKINT